MSTVHRALDVPNPDPERNGDEQPPSQTNTTNVKYGSMGLSGQWGLIGNATAMLILVVFLFIVDSRSAKKDEKIYEIVDKVNTTSDKHATALESHIATQIVETRNHTAATDRLTHAVDKSTQATERLIWATGVAGGWPFTPKKGE